MASRPLPLAVSSNRGACLGADGAAPGRRFGLAGRLGAARATAARQAQRGLTLVELMVSLVLGLAVGGSVLYVYVGTVSTHNDTNTLTQLEEELSAVLSLMVRDIRRAGYDADGFSYAVSSSSTVFINDFGLDEGASDLGSSPGCLLYTYDEDRDGTLDSGERFGWRLKDGAVERRSAGAACSASGWQDITWTTYANITGLTFTVVPSSVTVELSDRTLRVDTSQVNISITGSAMLRGGATVSRTLEESVRVRNDALTQVSP